MIRATNSGSSWLALDVFTREMVGVYVGARSEHGARQPCNSLPGLYRQCAIAYTDFWDVYGCVFPKKRHRPVGKETGNLYRTVQLYDAPESLSSCSEDPLIFQEARESYWSY